VDWESASVGPPEFDIAHCRLNFFFETPELAEFLRIAWERATGGTYDPWADLAAVICVLDQLRDHPPGSSAREVIDQAVMDAIASRG
jgi:hypothetical protein